jgi:hypothetical protein
MADTIGSLVDKLGITNLKMFNTQEKLYDIRRDTLESFKKKYMNDKGMEYLYKYFIDVSDLNLMRNNYIDEIDQKIIEIIKAGLNGQDLDNGSFIQRKHKTLKSEV